MTKPPAEMLKPLLVIVKLLAVTLSPLAGRTGLAVSLLVVPALARGPLWAQEERVEQVVAVSGDSVTIRLVDADVRGAIQALGRYLDRPVVFGAVGEGRITLETPRPIPREDVVHLLRSVLGTQGLDMLEEGGVYRILQGREPGAGEQDAQGPVQLFVIRLRHARADDVAATVNALYGRVAALGLVGAPPRTLAEQLREYRVPPAGRPTEPQQSAPVLDRPAALEGEVTIVPDPRTNSLLVRSTPRDFELIRAAVEELDVRPLQVLIEVVIAEVRRDRALALGVDAEVPPHRLSGAGDAEVSGLVTGLGLGDFVLSVMKLGGIDLEATLRVAASRGDVTILSRPVLLTANNEHAEILVGTQRPFVQVQRALPTDAPLRDQVIQFKDVGTRLLVRPTISGDGYVMLHVIQEVNAATAEIAFDAPVISTRTVQTQLLIKDGHTAVLGGLADRQHDVNRSGIPVLSAIPIFGGLFGRTSRRTTETELFLFLTPRVIYDDEGLSETSRDVRDSARHVGNELKGLEFPQPVPPDSLPEWSRTPWP